MDGIQNLYRNSVQFAERHYRPTNAKEFFIIGAYLVFTFYITDYFMNYRLFKWIYLGTILILLASWYSYSDSNSGNVSGNVSGSQDQEKGMFILGSR